MTEPNWLDREALVELHHISLKRFGGMPGLRDEGLMEAALARPRQVYAYNPDADIFDLATAYAAAFVRNHAFVDGNKRAGFTACLVFLADNGWMLNTTPADATTMMVGLAGRRVDEVSFSNWLRTHCVPR